MTRNEMIYNAREKYIKTGITNDITEAMGLYMADIGERDEPLFITTPEIHKLKEILKKLRPLCEDCESELFLKLAAKDINGKEYPTAWVCSKCDLVEYSDKTPGEWLMVLQNENRKSDI